MIKKPTEQQIMSIICLKTKANMFWWNLKFLHKVAPIFTQKTVSTNKTCNAMQEEDKYRSRCQFLNCNSKVPTVKCQIENKASN